MRLKIDFLLAITFTIFIISIAFFTQHSLQQVTGYAAGDASICVGHTPVLGEIGDMVVFVGLPYVLDINHTITEGDVIYSDTTSVFIINPDSGLISFTPAVEDIGNYTIMILVNNTLCPQLGDLEELELEASYSNLPPVLDYIGNRVVWEDDLLSIDLDATDPDGDNLVYSCNDTTHFTVDGITGLIEWWPSNDNVGLHWFECTVTDDGNPILSDSEIFSVLVRNTNDAPIFFDNVVNFTVENGNPLYEDVEFMTDVKATDPDGDTVSFLDNTSLFEILTIDWDDGSKRGRIYITSDASLVGNHSAEVYALDGLLTSVEIFIFEILATNDPPVLHSIGAQTAEVNEPFYFDVNAEDEEDGSDYLDNTEKLTFFINDTSLFDINSKTGVISFTPDENDIGNYTFNISVMDSGIPEYGLPNATDSEVISFVVTEENLPPNITSYSPETPFTMDTGESQDLTITAEDPNGGTPSAQWYLDASLIIDSTGYTYTFSPSIVGVFNLTVVITDGEFEDIQEWNITVEAAPPPPPGPGVGGGGAGGGKYFCKEIWVCGEWATCMITDIQIRNCYDVRECGSMVHKPPEARSCIYVPIETCFDGIRNQNEILVDCNGVCSPCSTCSDKICNQGEQCERCDEYPERCPLDFEENVIPDCGGPCPKCPQVEKPLRPKTTDFKKIIVNFAKTTVGVILLLLLVTLITVGILRRISKKNVLTEQEKLEIGIMDKINNAIISAEKAIDVKDKENLVIICKNIEKLYNTLSSTKNKKKVYPKIRKLERYIKVGF